MTDDKGTNEESKALKPPESNANHTKETHEDFNDLDTGWAWIVLISSFGTFCLIGSLMYAVGIIHSSLLDRYEESVSLTAWAGAIHTSSMSIGGNHSTNTSFFHDFLFFIFLKM